MDTSKEYILMCEKAEEIQKYWEEDPKQGGSFGDYVYFVKEFEICIVRRATTGCQKHCIMQPQDDYASICMQREAYIEKQYLIWLPRQDQLQEMFSCNEPYLPLYVLDDTVRFMKYGEDYYKQFLSMEQLWLAFVMSERYQKHWDGKNWIVRGGER